MNLRHDTELEINGHLMYLANQVAEDIEINVNEEEVVPNEHETVDGVSRKISEGEQQLEKEVSWLKWVPNHISVMSQKEIQDG